MCLHLSLALLPRMQEGLCLSQSPLCVHCLQFHACTWAALRLFQKWLLWSLTFRYSPCPWHLSQAVGVLIFCQQPTSFLLTALGPLPALCLPPTSCLAASLVWISGCMSLSSSPPSHPALDFSPRDTQEWKTPGRRPHFSALNPQSQLCLLPPVCLPVCQDDTHRDCPLSALISGPCGVLMNA